LIWLLWQNAVIEVLKITEKNIFRNLYWELILVSDYKQAFAFSIFWLWGFMGLAFYIGMLILLHGLRLGGSVSKMDGNLIKDIIGYFLPIYLSIYLIPFDQSFIPLFCQKFSKHSVIMGETHKNLIKLIYKKLIFS
jgi:hypothetical protein